MMILFRGFEVTLLRQVLRVHLAKIFMQHATRGRGKITLMHCLMAAYGS